MFAICRLSQLRQSIQVIKSVRLNSNEWICARNTITTIKKRFIASSGRMRSNYMYDGDLAKEVTKDITLYENPSQWFFIAIQTGGLIGLGLYFYLAAFTQTYLRNPSQAEEEKRIIESNAGIQESKGFNFFRTVSSICGNYKGIMTGFCVVMGYGTLAVSSLYTTRSIQSIVLKKGGQGVIVRTLPALPYPGWVRKIEAPLKNISCNQTRHEAHRFITIKIKGYRLFFILSKDSGSFNNPGLFDRSVGLYRVIGK